MRLTCLFLLAAPALTQGQAFLQPQSAAPGETVQVYVSSGATYRVAVNRSHYFGIETPLLLSEHIAGAVQPVTAGSFAFAPDAPSLDINGPMSLEAWVRPIVSTGTFAGILMKYAFPNDTAYGIYLMPTGELSFYLGDDGIFDAANRLLTTAPIPNGTWTHVVATYDGQFKRVYLNGQLDVEQARSGNIFDTAEPLRVASFSAAANHFEGDIDSPAVYTRALSAAEIQTRHAERAQYGPSNPGVLGGCVAQFNFDEAVGTTLADVSGTGNDMTLVNQGTRGIPGPLLPGAMGKPANWAIRFSAVDSYNPAWTPSTSFVVDPAWDAGFYAVRIRNLGLPLIVKPAPGAEASIAVLANSNTWAAYNDWSHSLYQTKPGGSISRYVGLRQPSPNARLDIHQPGSGFSPRVDAERYLYKWLDDRGYEFDLYTDLDLHKSPTLLSKYRLLIIQGHSEYWSAEMIDHVEAFLAAGGSLINLSGNTMWTRVTFNPDFTVMEGRKHPWGGFPNVFPPEERWHSQDDRALGGTWRCIGRPEHEVLGTGYGIETFSSGVFGAYQVREPGHWLFAGTGVELGTLFGQDSENGGGILGHEFDVVHAQWSPANIQVLARGTNLLSTSLDISNCDVRVVTPVSEGGDMVFFEHPGGGGVFGAPSVAFSSALFVDPVASQVLDNAIRNFLGRHPWLAAPPFRD